MALAQEGQTPLATMKFILVDASGLVSMLKQVAGVAPVLTMTLHGSGLWAYAAAQTGSFARLWLDPAAFFGFSPDPEHTFSFVTTELIEALSAGSGKYVCLEVPQILDLGDAATASVTCNNVMSQVSVVVDAFSAKAFEGTTCDFPFRATMRTTDLFRKFGKLACGDEVRVIGGRNAVVIRVLDHEDNASFATRIEARGAVPFAGCSVPYGAIADALAVPGLAESVAIGMGPAAPLVFRFNPTRGAEVVIYVPLYAEA